MNTKCGTFRPLESFSMDTQTKINVAIDEAKSKPKEEEQDWYFTFCESHYTGVIPLYCRYVVIKGTYNSARQQMHHARSDAWGFQYNHEQFKDQPAQYNLKEITLDEVKVREL